jgi:hypothetical protein
VRAEEPSGFGAVLGVGVIAGAVWWLTRPRGLGSPRETPRFDGAQRPQGPTRFGPLVERWRAEVAKRAQDLPVDALLEWIRIESGGDMDPSGLPTEAGIWQLMFPDDARYGASLDALKALAARSRTQNPRDISWLSEPDLDMQVGSGIRKVAAARDTVRRVFSANGVTWPENSFDFGAAVKQIHAAPAVITELVPKITRAGGPPSSWIDLRQRVMTFPVDQMGTGLRRLAGTPSKHRLKNRLEDTLNNAEFVGRAWARG